LSATGFDIQWYSAPPASELLGEGTELVDGATYYATQTVNDCESTDKLEVTVTLYQKPTVDNIPDQTLCHGEASTEVVFSGSPSTGVTYKWVNTGDHGIRSTDLDNGSGTISSFSAINFGPGTKIGTIIVTPETAPSCQGDSKTFTITVNPKPERPKLKGK
jgi:hypothetical protein